ncbi:procyclic form surface glycoprotein, partial [Trypanosoma conorhini]
MFCGILDAVEDCFKTVVAVACCLILGGPVLIIVGTLFLRQEDGKKSLTAALKEFDPAPLNAWTGTINDVPITLIRRPIDVEGVPRATSIFAEAVIPVTNPASEKLSVSVKVDTVTPFTRDALLRYSKRTTHQCSTAKCKAGQHCQCEHNARAFQDKCAAMRGTFDGFPRWCTVGRLCGECTLTVYLTQLYLVAREISKGEYTEDTSFRSANYNFDDRANVYEPTMPSSITVRLYSDKDPYIAVQRATKGTGKLGANPHTVGIIMIVLGVLFLLLEIGVCTALICYFTRRKDTTSDALPHAMQGEDGSNYDTPVSSPPPPPPQPQPQGYGYGQPPPPQPQP